MRSLIFCSFFSTKLWWLPLAPMSVGHLITCFWRCISVVSLLLFPLSISENFIILGFNWRPLWGDGEKLFLEQSYLRDSWFLLYSGGRWVRSRYWKLWELLFWYVYLLLLKNSVSSLSSPPVYMHLFICAWAVWLDLWCSIDDVEHTESGNDKKESTLKTS